MNNKQLGEAFEQRAASYLEDQGLNILARNFRCNVGEIDVIAKDAEYIAFVEVRYRRSQIFGGAIESVTRAKISKLCKAARAYLQRYPYARNSPMRFDILALCGELDDLEYDWIKDAFYEA